MIRPHDSRPVDSAVPEVRHVKRIGLAWLSDRAKTPDAGIGERNEATGDSGPGPWRTYSGTAGAHVMISPPKP